MGLRYKSMNRISSIFSPSSASKLPESAPTHLIWVLLASASKRPQYGDLYSANVERLVTTISIEKGVHSVYYLQNAGPAYTLSGSTATSPRASPVSLLVNVNDESSFRACLRKLRGLLDFGGFTEDEAGNQILHWSLATYASTQFQEPRRARDLVGKCVVTVVIEPTIGQVADVDAWYRKEHLAMLSTSPLFLRCRRYVRVLDPSTVDQSEGATAAKFLAVHDYTSVQDLLDHSLHKGQLVQETPWTRRVMDGTKAVERTIWTIRNPLTVKPG